MNRFRIALTGLTMAAALLIPAGVAQAGTVTSGTSGTIINYSCGPNIDPSYYTDPATRTTIMSRSLPGGGEVDLRKGWDPSLGNYDYWTRVINNSTKTLHLDWSDDGGADFHICKTLVYSDSNSAYTYAVNNWGGRVYKAFAYVNGTWYGSSSWQH
jgi:hypothetical protein